MRFEIHEVSPEWRRYVHRVEADSPEQARERFNNGEATLAEDWPQGTHDAAVEGLDTEIQEVMALPPTR